MTSANDLFFSPNLSPLDMCFEGCRELTRFIPSWPFFSSDCLGCLQPAFLALSKYEHIWATEAGLKGFICLFFTGRTCSSYLLTFQVSAKEQALSWPYTSVEADLEQVQWASVPSRQGTALWKQAVGKPVFTGARPSFFSDLLEQKKKGGGGNVQHLTVCLSSTPARKCLFASNWP